MDDDYTFPSDLDLTFALLTPDCARLRIAF
jgi:hypothetical protein